MIATAENDELTCEQAGKILGISAYGIRYLIRAGRLLARRHGKRQYIIQREDLWKIQSGRSGRPRMEAN